MEHDDAIALVRQVYDAYARKDRPALEALVAEDFHFTSPLDNRLDRHAYFDVCWPNSEWIAGYRFCHLVAQGATVFVTYEATTSKGTRLRNTEIVQTRGHQIVEVEVYFGWSIPHEAAAGRHVDPVQPAS